MEEPAFRDWWEPYETVLDLWRQGRLDESAALIEQGRREYPGAPALTLAAARQIVEEDAGRRLPANVARARELIRRAVAADPQPAVLLSAAITSYRLGDGEAARAYTEALEPAREAPDDAAFRGGLFHLLALLARDRGEIGEALDGLRRAVAADPEEPEHAADLAEVLIEQGELEEARRVLQDALQRAPGDAELVRLSAGLRIRFPSLDGGKLSFTVRRAPRPGG